ncbi:antitoxin VbhA family protein [Pseudolysinimonas kribbensis]
MSVHLLEPSEWARRRRIVTEIRDSTRLAGGRSSDEAHRIQDRWVEGEITREEMGELIRSIDLPLSP